MSISFDGSLIGDLLATLYYLLYLGFGFFLASRLFREKERPLFRVVMGSAIGTFLLHWCPIIMAFFFRFTLAAQLVALVIPVLLCVLAWRFLSKKNDLWEKGEWEEHALILILGIATFLFYAVTLWKHTIAPGQDGSMWAGQCTYGDMNIHMAIITHLVNSSKFPIDYPIFPGYRLCYPFLSDSISSSLFTFGASLRWAYVLPMLVAFLQTMSGMYLLTETWLKDKTKSLLAWIMFFFCGGFGFIYFYGVTGMSGTNYTFAEIFKEFYHTPTNLVNENIRWVNVIVDMLIPQRATLFGWAMFFPCLVLLYRAIFEGKKKEMLIAGVLVGGLPMIHTHSFLAVGMICAVWLLYSLLPEKKKQIASSQQQGQKKKGKKQLGKKSAVLRNPFKEPYLWGLIAPIGLIVMAFLWKQNQTKPFEKNTLIAIYAVAVGAVFAFGVYALIKALQTKAGRGKLLYWGMFAGLVLLLALPQLFTWTFRQAAENSMVQPQFNWVNSDSDVNNTYIWFYLKNLGLPAVAALFGFIFASRRSFWKAAPALLIWATAEFFVFQPLFYDNNKLLYAAYSLLCILGAEFLVDAGRHLVKNQWVRVALTLIFVVFVSFSAVLSMGREYVSEYELYDKNQVEACRFIEANTPQDSMFITNHRHNNAICALTGRTTVCGAHNFLWTHGFDDQKRHTDVAQMFQNPQASRNLFQQYGVDYIFVSEYERSTFGLNESAIAAMFPKVYSNPSVNIYKVQ